MTKPKKSTKSADGVPCGDVLPGDCIRGMIELPDDSFDLVFADPPFNIGYKYDAYDDRRDDDDYLAWSRRWMQQVFRVLRRGGAFWLAIGDEFAAELKVAAHREIGFELRNWCVWYYTFGVACRRKFSRSHTHLLYFVKPGKKNGADITFNADAVRVPSARQSVYKDSRANPAGKIPDNTWILRPQELTTCINATCDDAKCDDTACDDDRFGFPTNTANTANANRDAESLAETLADDCWHFPRVCGTFREREGWHGCQMPEAILERIIRACTNPGERVLDPFAGSGTTLVVAKQLERRFLGFEISPEYRRQCCRRLAEES